MIVQNECMKTRNYLAQLPNLRNCTEVHQAWLKSLKNFETEAESEINPQNFFENEMKFQPDLA